MSGSLFRRGLLAAPLTLAPLALAIAQQAAKPKGFQTPDAAVDALTEAVRTIDPKAMAALLGPGWRDFAPTTDRDFGRDRESYLTAWDIAHKTTVNGDKAFLEVGKEGWTLPIPLTREGAEWRFDIEGGLREMAARELGWNEMGAIQTLLAIGDAERDYAELNPMKASAPSYARRLKSAPGRKDGLYWPTTRGQPDSPLGVQVADSQPDGRDPGGYYGYNYRLLYGQGPEAAGGARDYIIDGRMIGGFGAIAWPLYYGETGIMTFIVGHDGVVWQQDLGPETATRAGMMSIFNPGKGWEKADMTPP